MGCTERSTIQIYLAPKFIWGFMSALDGDGHNRVYYISATAVKAGNEFIVCHT